MNPESHIAETSAGGLPFWAQVALLVGFCVVLILRLWLDPLKTSRFMLRKTLRSLRKNTDSEQRGKSEAKRE